MGKNARKQAEKRAGSVGIIPSLEGLAFFARRGLRELVIGSGMSVLQAILEAERSELCGARYSRGERRRAHRYGYAPGELVMGGRRVSVPRPRARGSAGEIELPSFAAFSGTDPLSERAVESMLIGVSTRKYRRGLESLPEGLSERGTSKSTVSRRFVQATEAELAKHFGRSLTGLDLKAIYIDGLAFGDERMLLIALGVDAGGYKHVLGTYEGATENGAACGGLLDDLIGRGVKTDRSMLFIIDGAKALSSAISKRFAERGVIQRCQVHKKRNVRDHLPEYMRPSVLATLSQAYESTDAVRAQKLLENLARSLEVDHPSAAASVREGLAETLTVVRLGLPVILRRGFATTNPIENINGTVRRICHRVKNWKSGGMVLRWTGAALREAEAGFRRINGHKSMNALIRTLEKNDERIDRKLDEKPATG